MVPSRHSAALAVAVVIVIVIVMVIVGGIGGDGRRVVGDMAWQITRGLVVVVGNGPKLLNSLVTATRPFLTAASASPANTLSPAKAGKVVFAGIGR